MKIKDNEKLINDLHSYKLDNFVISGKLGLEKENIRVRNKKISQVNHPNSLGSPLTNKYITTDFSESQIELVTPPFQPPREAHNFLHFLNEFAIKNIDNESLWCSSMPPYIESSDLIQIAKYGNSNLAAFKETYRRGLSNRYGNLMQTISGVHYNYSFSSDYLGLFLDHQFDQDGISKIYFRSLRNLKRINWLILYLFGASPVATRNFNLVEKIEFSEKKDFFYVPYSTSLRMSRIGYQNNARSQLSVSLNSLSEFINDIENATKTKSNKFSEIVKQSDEYWPQLNSNLLQIEDEFYEVVRPKSSFTEYKKLSLNLNAKGVDYIEFRSLDLDPFSPSGISLETIRFLEAIILYSNFIESPRINDQESKEIKNNDELVAIEGRNPDLELIRNGDRIRLKDWAIEILNDIEPIGRRLGIETNFFDSIERMIKDSNLTLSGKLMSELMDGPYDFHELIENYTTAHRKFYLGLDRKDNPYWEKFEKEASDSHLRKEQIESDDKESFESFIYNYFSEETE